MEKQDMLVQEETEDVVEMYGQSCGESDDAYHCKKDCIITYNSLFSAVH